MFDRFIVLSVPSHSSHGQVTEPGGGSDVAGLQTVAEQVQKFSIENLWVPMCFSFIQINCLGHHFRRETSMS